MSPTIHTTKDGSSTLYSDQYEQFYHNPNGAATESLYVFFDTPGVTESLKSNTEISVLEIGFGTGLNFILMLDKMMQLKSQTNVSFYSVEAFPVDVQTATSFDFKKHLKNPELNDLLPVIFKDLKPGLNRIKPLDQINATLYLYIGTFDSFSLDTQRMDYLFHDAFSPEVNEELWTKEVFRKLHSYSKTDGILSTYCAASKARAAMCAAGWYVASAPGALGKREMTIASPSTEPLGSFKRVNEERLAKRFAEGDFN